MDESGQNNTTTHQEAAHHSCNRIAELEGENERLRAGVDLLASLGHTQHHMHPQASHLGWQRCSLTECETARKILKHDAALRAEQGAAR